MPECIQECVPYQRSPYHGGHPLWQIEGTRLVIEVIAPACPVIASRLMLNQPLQCVLCFVSPNLVAGRIEKANETSRQKPHAFAGVLLINSQRWTQVQWKASYSLQKHRPQDFR